MYCFIHQYVTPVLNHKETFCVLVAERGRGIRIKVQKRLVTL